MRLEEATVPISEIVQHLERQIGRQADVKKATLAQRPDGSLVYLVTAGDTDPWLYDARTGAVAPYVTEAEAARIAREDFTGDGDVTTVRWLDAAEDVDYKGPFPVYRVDFSNAKHTRLYISPFSGQIVRRHNIYQTVRNVFWTLHVFGYLDREVAGNAPLLVTSAVSLVGIMSGTMLLVPYFRRRVTAMVSAPRRAPALTVQPQRE